jgi:hypothetical protein
MQPAPDAGRGDQDDPEHHAAMHIGVAVGERVGETERRTHVSSRAV